MATRNRMSSFGIRSRAKTLPIRTDVVDFSGGRRTLSDTNGRVEGIGALLQNLNFTDEAKSNDEVTSSEDTSIDDVDEPMDYYVEVVLATRANTRNVGWLITDECNAIGDEISIPFYDTVSEGGNFEGADWKDQPVVRQAQIRWRDDNEILWMERHMEMTQGFICVGKTPGLMILGEPTHERDDLTEEERHFPDITRMKGYIIPAGCGIIIKKGTWHDFPVSVGPTLTTFIMNTREVVDALMSMEEPKPMDFGDCYKIRNADVYQDVRLRFPDPRPIVAALGLLNERVPDRSGLDRGMHPFDSQSFYGQGMKREEVGKWGGSLSSNVWVVPIINVESFSPHEFGPSVQPHLNRKQPEIANQGWRDYGNKQGLKRLGVLFGQHGIRCTAVVSSDLVKNREVMTQLKNLKDMNHWEIGAHGANNSTGGLSTDNEPNTISCCLEKLGRAFGGKNPKTWLTPGFSVSNSTSKHIAQAGIEILLDYGDDDVPFKIAPVRNEHSFESLICLPYSMETNDFSLVLTRNLSPREYALSLESHILQLAQESKISGTPNVVCLGMHTFVSGTPATVYELDKMLSRLKSNKNINWATAEEVAESVKKGSNNFVPFQVPVSASTGHAKPSKLTQNNHEKLGLILIDFQNDFFCSEGFGEQLGNEPSKLHHVIEPTKEVLSAARSAGLTVIYTREGHRPNLKDLTELKSNHCSAIGRGGRKGRMMVRGEWGNDIISELKPLSDRNETVIDKPGKGAFYQTDLELILKNSGVDTLIVCGVTTEVCVHSTVREANDRGIKCIVLDDCTASYFDEFHRVGIDMVTSQGGILGEVSDSKSIIDRLEGLESRRGSAPTKTNMSR